MSNIIPINPVHGPPRPPPGPDQEILEAFQQSLLQLLRKKTPHLRAKAMKWAAKLNGPDDVGFHQWNWAKCAVLKRGEQVQVSFFMGREQILSLVWADQEEQTPILVDRHCRVIA